MLYKGLTLESDAFREIAESVALDGLGDEKTKCELARWVFAAGVGILKVTWDEKRKKVVAECLDPDEVYLKGNSGKL